MRNDADDDWVGGFAPESDNVIETSFARLNCAQTTVQPSTSHLTIKWSFDLKPAMAGRRLGAWLQTPDTADNTHGWGQFGDFFAGAITPAVIRTSKDDFALDLYDDDTPLTVANFKRLAKLGFFNGLNFHRVEDWVVQGGDGEASGRLATPIPLEPNWYRSFADVGQIGMARTDYIHSADSQFYINTRTADWLDPTSDTNGYSLLRKLFEWLPMDAVPVGFDCTLGEALLKSHRNYVPVLGAAIDGGKVKALAHITGGGLPENLPRVLPDGINARIHLGSWPVPPLFQLVREVAVGMATHELYRTLNMGVGMVVVCAAGDLSEVQASITEQTWVIGELITAADAGRTVVLL